MTVAAVHPHAQVIKTVLASASPPILSDHGIKPAAATPAGGYGVIWVRDTLMDGPSSDVHADANPEIQVTAVSSTGSGAEIIADRITAALLNARPPPPSGRAWFCPGQPIQFVQRVGAQRDDDTDPPAFFAPVIFQLPTTPA